MLLNHEAQATGHDRIQFIQALRGMAALGVVALHAGWAHLASTDHAVFRVITYGNAGVDLFFIISGFIMYFTIPSHAGGAGDAWAFLVKRITRIWPPYAFWTLVVTALALGIPATQPLLAPFRWTDLLASLTFMPTSVPLVAPMLSVPILGVGWTLNYEMYFYATLFLCLFSKRWTWWVFTGWLLLAMLVVPAITGTLALNPQLSPTTHHALLDLATSPIMWEFATGVAIAWIYRRGIRFTHRATSLVLCAIGMAWLILRCDATVEPLHGMTQAGLPLALIVLALALAPAGRLRLWRPLTWAGKVSYSLYLAHVPLILFLDWLLSIKGRHFGTPLLTVWIIFIAGVSLIVASVSHRFLEAGLSDRLRNLLLRARPSSALVHSEGAG